MSSSSRGKPKNMKRRRRRRRRRRKKSSKATNRVVKTTTGWMESAKLSAEMIIHGLWKWKEN
jgi:hypothetical protein